MRSRVVPRLSREGRWLATAVGAVSVLGVDVGRTDAHVLLLGAMGLLLASFVVGWRYRLGGVQVEARHPRRIAVGEEMQITVVVRNTGARRHEALRVEGPQLRRDGRWSQGQVTLEGLDAGGEASVGLRVRFGRRGQRRIGRVRVGALVPLGLAQGAPLETEVVGFLVVPRPARVVRVSTPMQRKFQPGGVAQASQVGDAREMIGLRPYRPGDSVRDLHARSWARLGFPVVREYQQEYFTRVGVVVDAEATRDERRFEATLSLAAGVVARLCGGETLVDVLVVGEQVHPLTLGRSLGTVDQAMEVLAGVKMGPRFLADGVLARLGPHLERLSSVVLVMMSWNEERARLASALRVRGVGCAVVVVGDGGEPESGRRVSVAAIESGEALVL